MTSGNPSIDFPPFPEAEDFPLKPDDHLDFLGAIQGNILKGHGRNCTRLLFFAADRRRTVPGALFREAVDQGFVTSAQEQWHQARSKDKSLRFFSLMLTKEYFYLFQQDRFPPDSGGAFKSGAFVRMGSYERTRTWRTVYRVHPHGVWLLAHENEEGLDLMEADLRAFVGRHHVRIMQSQENGLRWHDDGDRDALREPFGFRDGISGAGFIQPDAAAGPRVQIPLDQVLITTADEHAGGAYFVLQKLEQHVAGFRLFEREMKTAFATAGQALPVDSPGALLVGRERNGTPLAAGHTQLTNAFDFSADATGSRCPFHAHIRKANPRGASAHESETSILSRQFVRRSAVFDDHHQLPSHSSPDYVAGENITGEVGLLFMGYMSSILRQFEHMRLSWLESPSFPARGDSMPDPILNRQALPVTEWKWSAGGIGSVPGMPRFVTSRGAVFCYVPSIPWLKNQ